MASPGAAQSHCDVAADQQSAGIGGRIGILALTQHLGRADAMLVVGSSLMVYSGYRFVLEASRRKLPIASVNLGVTRADALLTLKIEQSCAEALAPYA